LVYFISAFGIFFPFWYVVPRKIWQPWSELEMENFFCFLIRNFFCGDMQKQCSPLEARGEAMTWFYKRFVSQADRANSSQNYYRFSIN
jgi:hypothetical protein